MRLRILLVVAVALVGVGCAAPAHNGAGSASSAVTVTGGSTSQHSVVSLSQVSVSRVSAPAPTTSGPAKTAGPPASCPAVVPRGETGLPDTATVTSPDRLLPVDPVRAAVLCSYNGSNMAPMAGKPLSHRVVLGGDLTLMTTDLRWAVPAGTGGSCTLIGGPQTNFLLGLTYDDGLLWVAATQDPNDCLQTTNGKFTSLGNDGTHFAAVLAAGRWLAAPKNPPVGPCGYEHRWGQQTAMVPVGATSVDICAQGARATTRISPPAQVTALAAALNALPVSISTRSCTQETDPKTGQPVNLTFFQLRFDYSDGPGVIVRLAQGCRPSVDNDSLEAPDATGVLALVKTDLDSAGK